MASDQGIHSFFSNVSHTEEFKIVWGNYKDCEASFHAYSLFKQIIMGQIIT